VRFRALSCLVLSLLLMAALPVELRGSPLQRLEIPPLQKPGAEDEQRVRMEKEMAKKAAQARQAEMKRDTEKLLKLATDLKADVDKTNEGTLSLDVIKKAEEIEKLAHAVKDRMKGTY
jgi:predicted  nucleic acid-binding Zn-ribbon protein